jgi:hypothetical protein
MPATLLVRWVISAALIAVVARTVPSVGLRTQLRGEIRRTT